MVEDGDGEARGQCHVEEDQRPAERRGVEVAHDDRDGAGRLLRHDPDAEGLDAPRVVVQRLGGHGRGVDGQPRGQVLRDRLRRGTAAHQRAGEVDRPPRGGLPADAPGHDLRLRRQDQLHPVLVSAIALPEEDVLRARADVDGEDALGGDHG